MVRKGLTVSTIAFVLAGCAVPGVPFIGAPYSSLTDVLKVEATGKLDWNLAVPLDDKEYLKSHDELKAFLDTVKSEGDIKGVSLSSEKQAIYKNFDTLRTYFSSFGLLGDDLTYFLTKDNMPIRFAQHNGQTAIIVTRVTTGNVYNTFKLNEKERASSVVKSCILPEIRDVRDIASKVGAEYAGVNVFYGSRDFAEEGKAAAEGEMACLVATRSAIERLDKAEITDDEFIKSSDVYLSGRNSPFAVTKISLVSD